MSIHRAQSGKWIVRYRDADRNRSKSFSLKADAERYDAEVRRRKELGELILSRRDVPTLREEAVDWLASKTDLAVATEQLYADRLEHQILPELGGLKLVDVRPRVIESWQRGLLSKGTSARVVQQARVVLSQILTRAVAHEYIAGNPMQAISGPKHRTERREPATVEQVEAMRGYFLKEERRRDALLISVLAYTGIRPPQESHGLMWSDIEGRFFHLRRKNVYGKLQTGLKMEKERRAVEIPGPVAVELAEYGLSIGRRTGLIFPTRAGKPFSKSDWGNFRRRHFDKARKAAGLPEKFRPYDLRHTCASLMIASGATSPEVAEQLGHSVSQSESTYQHLIRAMRGEEKIPLDELIQRSRNVPRKAG